MNPALAARRRADLGRTTRFDVAERAAGLADTTRRLGDAIFGARVRGGRRARHDLACSACSCGWPLGRALLRRRRSTPWARLDYVPCRLCGTPSRLCSLLNWTSLRQAALQRIHQVDDVLRRPCRSQVSRRLLRLLLAQLFDQHGAIAILKISRIEVFGLRPEDMLGYTQHLIRQP